MRRARFIIAAFLLCSCASTQIREASQSDIVAATKRLIAQLEHCANEPYVNPQQDKYDGTWRVEVHEFGEPIHNGEILFLPGTHREILFTRSGRLISYYVYPNNV